MTDLEREFDDAMMEIYRRALDEARYPATKFRTMLLEHRGIKTAQILINADSPSDGYTALWERRRLDLTVEALVHDTPKFQPLFKPEEIEKARKRLADYEYPPAMRKG